MLFWSSGRGLDGIERSHLALSREYPRTPACPTPFRDLAPCALPSIFLLHRYPKDIWPGHKPPNHAAGVGEANGAGVEGAEEEQLEFFCDACDETIPNGVERMECAVCPDEFCLCHGCYDEGEVRGTVCHDLLSAV